MMGDHDDGMTVTYLVTADAKTIDARALEICVEQTVEVTEPLWRDPSIADQVVGRLLSIAETGEGQYAVRIHFPGPVMTAELTQVLNVLYGNVSMKEGIRVIALDLSAGLARKFQGPVNGISGLRDLLGVEGRPLVISALKPLGRTIRDLAGYAHDMALGGIDIVKDDHGIVNQTICPFNARVEACADAVARAGIRTGRRCLYFPTVTGPADEIVARGLFAKAAGAGGLLISPLVTGLDFVRLLARETGLPVMVHPALTGSSFSRSDHGMDPHVLLGTLMRLAGADLVIFPTWGGRFPFSRETCVALDEKLKGGFHGFHRTMPVPAGGLTLERVSGQVDVFGMDVAFLIGSALYERSTDLVANAAFFRSLVES